MQKSKIQPERLTYTVDEAAKLIGVGRNLAYEMAKSGELPVMRARNRILVLAKPLHRMLDGATVEAA